LDRTANLTLSHQGRRLLSLNGLAPNATIVAAPRLPGGSESEDTPYATVKCEGDGFDEVVLQDDCTVDDMVQAFLAANLEKKT
jgi:hypothetical protein